jgi:hypothetical protein
VITSRRGPSEPLAHVRRSQGLAAGDAGHDRQQHVQVHRLGQTGSCSQFLDGLAEIVFSGQEQQRHTGQACITTAVGHKRPAPGHRRVQDDNVWPDPPHLDESARCASCVLHLQCSGSQVNSNPETYEGIAVNQLNAQRSLHAACNPSRRREHRKPQAQPAYGSPG